MHKNGINMVHVTLKTAENSMGQYVKNIYLKYDMDKTNANGLKINTINRRFQIKSKKTEKTIL